MTSFATADHGVCGFGEGVAGHGHDVQVLGVFFEPGFFDEGAVGDDGDGFHREGFFAVPVDRWIGMSRLSLY